jgi:hypothetical protein
MKTMEDEQLEASEKAVKDIEPSDKEYSRVFQFPMPDGTFKDVIYIQAPLGMFPAQEFLNMMTRIAKDISDGKYGIDKIDIAELIAGGGKKIKDSIPDEFTPETMKDLWDSYAKVVQAFLHLIDIVPELQQNIIALSLGVRQKNNEREWFKEMISEPPHRGGLTLDEGTDILKVFIRQNVSLIKRFLGENLVQIGQELMTALEWNPPEPEIETPMNQNTDSTGGMPLNISSQDIQENG